MIREFAGIYGESHGLTTQTGIEDGIRTFANTPEQDAFRHAFVHGVRALENWDHERYLNSLPLFPIRKTNEQLFDSVSDAALWWGFADEFVAPNPMDQHLMDMWNNGVGVELAREFMLARGGDRSQITNKEFAAFAAQSLDPKLFNTLFHVG